MIQPPRPILKAFTLSGVKYEDMHVCAKVASVVLDRVPPVDYKGLSSRIDGRNTLWIQPSGVSLTLEFYATEACLLNWFSKFQLKLDKGESIYQAVREAMK